MSKIKNYFEAQAELNRMADRLATFSRDINDISSNALRAVWDESDEVFVINAMRTGPVRRIALDGEA
jgi:hypothetical protein